MTDMELPDLDKMYELVDNIYDLSMRIGRLKIFLKVKEAEITLESSTNEKYFVNGKIPSQAFIDSTYKQTGFEGVLIAKRVEYEELQATLEKKKAEFELYKLQIDLWRTQSANIRMTAV